MSYVLLSFPAFVSWKSGKGGEAGVSFHRISFAVSVPGRGDFTAQVTAQKHLSGSEPRVKETSR